MSLPTTPGKVSEGMERWAKINPFPKHVPINALALACCQVRIWCHQREYRATIKSLSLIKPKL